jgi:hypothetical protein
MAKNAYAWGKMKKKEEQSPGDRILNEFRAKQKKIAHTEKKKRKKAKKEKKAKKSKKEWYQKERYQ